MLGRQSFILKVNEFNKTSFYHDYERRTFYVARYETSENETQISLTLEINLLNNVAMINFKISEYLKVIEICDKILVGKPNEKINLLDVLIL